jgi:hypothetical protein
MLKSAALLVMLVAAPAFADAAVAAPRTDVATVKRLLAEAATLLQHRAPVDLALAVADVNVTTEVEQALRAPAGVRLKVAPR